MKGAHIILAGIAGTTTFSIFSYLMAKQSKKSYKQPELLGKMMNRMSFDLDKKEAEFAGWLMHYLIGIGFATAYKIIIDRTGIKPNLTNGVLAGAISGIPAGLSWLTALKLHPAPPRKNSWNYYVELVAGHILFGMTCFLCFKKLRRPERIPPF